MPVFDLEDILGIVADGRPEEAVPLLESVLDNAPGYAAAHVVLARTFESLGRWKEALKQWQRTQFLVPNSRAVEAGIIRTVEALSAPEKAVRPPVDWARVRKPGSRAWTPVGKTLQAAGQLEPAVAAGFDDLDRLIDELESARIIPDPHPESIPAPDLDDEIDDVVSETLARIYATQSQYEEAAVVYEKLAHQQPDRAGEFMARAEEMRKKK